MPFIRDLLSSTGRRGRLPRLQGTSTAAGVNVDAERSLQVSAVYACVRLISEAIGQLPVHLYRRDGDSRIPVDDHPLLPVLTGQTNDDIDAGEFWRTMTGWMLLRGNGIAFSEIGGDGRAKALWPISPTSVKMARSTRGKRFYKVTLNDAEYVPGFTTGRVRSVPAEKVLHYRAFGLGTWGLSPVGLARTKVGTAFAAEQYGAGFFARGANPGGALTTKQKLTDEQFDRTAKQWNDRHGGFDNAHRVAVLEGGLSWENIGLPPAEAQFLETQKYEAATIAGHLFGVPPHMIGDVERSTSWGSGIAEQGIGFVRYSLMPWIVRLERVTNRLLTEPDLFVKFNTDALERGDLKSRYEAYAIGKQWGWKSTNDIKQLEDEQPVDGGDTYLQPLNMVPANTFDDGQPRSQASRSGRGDTLRDRHVDAHRKALRRFFSDQSEQLLAEYDPDRARAFDRPTSDARLGQILTSLGLASATDAATQVTEKFGSKMDSTVMAGWMVTMGANAAEKINDTTVAAVAAAADVESIRTVFADLADNRAPQIAMTRVTEAFGFGRSEAAKQVGATRKTWVTTSGNPRTEHAAMDGETVNTGDTFSNGARWPGDSILPVEESAGCQCDMVMST